MSKINNLGLQQIQRIKDMLASMHDKLDTVVYTKKKPTKNDDVNYKKTNLFSSVQEEFQAITEIVNETSAWEEVE
mgnify:CR=1 FL=1|tara:strand:- start:175 stop:399 length:225 start_codon:yes stop_codon:yes gene_type:complete